MAAADPSAASAADERLDAPLVFGRIFLEKPWGGRSLERLLGIALPDGRIGESWELSDRRDHPSVVAAGPYEGRELRRLMLSHGKDLLGEARPSPSGAFPLLVKYLDVTQPLSVQVHPDAPTAARLRVEGPKTECWYVLAAEPGAIIHLGLKPEADPADFAEHADGPEVVDYLNSFEVQAGEFVFVPAGTVHAIGAGVTILEVQENCDVTFRLWDWGRVGKDGRPRESHVEQALLAIRYEEPVLEPFRPTPTTFQGHSGRAQLVDCEAFAVELLEVHGRLALGGDGLPSVVVVLEGRARIRKDGRSWAVERGDVQLVPAALGPHVLEPLGGDARVLRATPKAGAA
jgi:mannose-6-phosphate isomerase